MLRLAEIAKKKRGPKIDDSSLKVTYACAQQQYKQKNAKMLKNTYLVRGNENFACGSFEFIGVGSLFEKPRTSGTFNLSGDTRIHDVRTELRCIENRTIQAKTITRSQILS